MPQEQIVKLSKSSVISAAGQGYAAFCELFAHTALQAVGGSLTAESMSRLNGDQITLIAYTMLRDEVLEGGFVQLIHNGYGPFFFDNPFAKAMRLMGLREFCNLLYDVRREYVKTGSEIARDCSDEEFMALYEQYPEYEAFDDEYVEREAEITEGVARYVDEHIDTFAVVYDD